MQHEQMTLGAIALEASPWFQLGFQIAKEVFAPDYYHGPWSVHWRGYKKVCTNYTTACAWARYIRRRFSDPSVHADSSAVTNDGWTVSISKHRG